ncbi:MAG: hypothetical protein RH982_11060 [Parvibaculum sp.]
MERIVVLTQRDSPTCDIYLRDRLASCSIPVHYWYLGNDAPVALDGAYVIIVRYVDSRSIAALERAQDNLCAVVYLLDDDLASAAGDTSLPLHYRLIIGRFWSRYAHRLSNLTSELWLSSDVLASRYAQATPVYRIDPNPARFPLPRDRPPRPAGPVRIFYHGQKTHGADREWLDEIISEVHLLCPAAEFELIGGPLLRWKYRREAHVTVRSAMSWPAYRALSATERFDIGLAPLVQTPFNAARSWTKYLDIARFGAVGLYAAGEPYAHVVRDGVNGRLLSSGAKSTWVEALSRLIRDSDLCDGLIAGVGWPEHVATPPALAKLADGEADRLSARQALTGAARAHERQ